MEIVPGLVLAAIVLMFFAHLQVTWKRVLAMEESAERVRLRRYFASAVLLVVPMLIIFLVVAVGVRVTPLEAPLVRRLFFIGWNLSGIAGILLALRASLPLAAVRDAYGLIAVHTGLLFFLYVIRYVGSTPYVS